jgi:hypothetical protein
VSVMDGLAEGDSDVEAEADTAALGVDDDDDDSAIDALARADALTTLVDDALADSVGDAVVVDAQDTLCAVADGDAEKVGVGATGGAHASRDALHVCPSAQRAPPRSAVHEGPVDTFDGHQAVATDVPHDGGAIIVRGDVADAIEKVKMAYGAQAAALTPTHAICAGDHVFPSAQTVLNRRP